MTLTSDYPVSDWPYSQNCITSLKLVQYGIIFIITRLRSGPLVYRLLELYRLEQVRGLSFEVTRLPYKSLTVLIYKYRVGLLTHFMLSVANKMVGTYVDYAYNIMYMSTDLHILRGHDLSEIPRPKSVTPFLDFLLSLTTHASWYCRLSYRNGPFFELAFIQTSG